ncbi:YgaP family membrane protein [Paenibacillus lautus]|uniref:YgaP family membrane protein n=1 Tax=Paenibacillus lautus TaxID=1401 RepID=UPI003D28B084
MMRRYDMKNVGGIDRLFRFILSFPLLFVLFYLDSNWRYVGLIGLVLLFNTLTRICFINRIFGINSCQIKRGTGERPL